MSANHVLLQRLEVSNSTSTVVSFRNIPQTGYTDLKIVVSGRTVRSGTDRSNDFLLTFNDSASGYSRKDLGDSPVRSTGGSSLSNIGRIQMPSDDATSNTFGNAEIYIANYTSSQNKAVTIDNVSQDNNTYGPTWLVAGLWSSSSSISSISLTADQSGTITAGSTFSLYGIAKLGTTPEIAPKATGGDIITNDGEYWYHAFLTTGAFKPKNSLTCDYLLVAGAGGGAVDFGGGGGAGGYRTTIGSSPIILAPDLYTISVGAGGIGGTRSNGADGGNGTASSISSNALGSISAAGGGGGGSYNGTKNGKTGGSGGGGAGGYGGDTRGNGGAGNTPATTPAQGTDGGYGYVPGGYESNRYGGGGGGATGSGGNATSGAFGQGGTGASSSISGTYSTYATGGKGCEGQSFSGAVSGAANTGNGGQGGGENYAGGSGGSGIVIIRYAMA